MEKVSSGSAIQWEKCARLLLVNSPNDLSIIKLTADTLILNIINNPTEVRYRTLNCANKNLSEKLLSKSGGVEYLLCVGFSVLIDEATDSKLLRFSKRIYSTKKDRFEAPLSDREIVDLRESLEWMNSTISDCMTLWNMRKSLNPKISEEDPCAECILQIKLPTGTSVSGGFLSTDKLLDVQLFAKAFFNPER